MSGAIYTERFLVVNAAAGTFTWPVPAGKRAVVRSATMTQTTGKPTGVQLLVAGIPLMAFVFSPPPNWAFVSWEGYAVAKAGELLTFISGPEASCFTGGYLFDDP